MLTEPRISNPPDRPLVLYDGECGFCMGQARRIGRLDRAGRLDVLPIQDAQVQARFAHEVSLDVGEGMRLIEPDGRMLVAADAVHGVARRLPWVRGLAWLYRVPLLHGLARWGYGLIARNRHRLAGRCRLEDAHGAGLDALPDDLSERARVLRERACARPGSPPAPSD